jgi:hypothetical protein
MVPVMAPRPPDDPIASAARPSSCAGDGTSQSQCTGEETNKLQCDPGSRPRRETAQFSQIHAEI